MKCALWVVVAVAVIGFITLLLWNWLVPRLFNGPEITYFEALGLLLLSKILFWGFGGKNHSHCNGHTAAPYWKQRFYEKFSKMSAEDREVFKQKMKEKWCGGEQKVSDRNSAE